MHSPPYATTSRLPSTSIYKRVSSRHGRSSAHSPNSLSLLPSLSLLLYLSFSLSLLLPLFHALSFSHAPCLHLNPGIFSSFPGFKAGLYVPARPNHSFIRLFIYLFYNLLILSRHEDCHLVATVAHCLTGCVSSYITVTRWRCF